MSLLPANGWKRMCPGCGARGCGCGWDRGALVLTCDACESEFTFIPKARSIGRGIWVRKLSDPTLQPGGTHHDGESRRECVGLCGTEGQGGEDLPVRGRLREGEGPGES